MTTSRSSRVESTRTAEASDGAFDVEVQAPGTQASATWETCSAGGCRGARIGVGAHCLGHLDDTELTGYLQKLSLGHGLDARGSTIDDPLLRRVFAACPADSVGRRRLRSPRFDQATFIGDVSFDGVSLERDAYFDKAVFTGAASFNETVFRGSARFAQATFTSAARFDGARFDGNAWFAGATFSAGASFDNARFSGMARFVRAVFEADARFAGVTFRSDASFDNVAFGCHGHFPTAVFEADASFEDATFANPGNFGWATFKGKRGIPAVADVSDVAWSGPPLASWRTRAGGSLLDNAITGGIVVAGGLFGLILDAMRYGGGPKFGLVLGVLAALAFAVRNLIEQGETGQTFGKRHVGVRLIRVRDRRAVGPLWSIGRQLLHVVDVVPLGAGLLWPLRDPKHQTFADKIAGTVVVIGRELPVAGREAAESAAAAMSAGSG